jgi:UDP-N-acetylglucosamine 1-carboxyvinyltransferase
MLRRFFCISEKSRYDAGMSEYFSIKGAAGKRTLEGTIEVGGAKNAVLKAIAASVLYKTPLHLSNVPHIEDVSRMLDIVRDMGGSASLEDHRVIVDAHKLSTTTIPPDIAKRIRASVVMTGPMLARYGRVQFPHPGGDVIGKRPIDLFIEGFENMGAKVSHTKDGLYDIVAPEGGLRGAEIFFRVASVTGTETLLMAAVLAKGTTVIKNAALEPEIVWLADMLAASGAKIEGAGTTTITIKGGGLLAQKNNTFRVIPDRIEAGSFLVLGALAAKKLTLTGVVPEHLESLIASLRYAGVQLSFTKDTITVESPKNKKHDHPLRAFNLRTHEYPGFPSDLQSPMMVLLTQTEGESLVFETIFEGRLNYTDSLNRMGADITMMDQHRVLVKGPTKLSGKHLESPDIRAGLAFVIAAQIADGVSRIHSIYHIDRGYEQLESRLRAIGVQIERVLER